jgi:uncharacterized protein (TIGR01777 family)
MIKKNVLITGGTGLIGKVLSKKLKLLGYTPIILSTSLRDENTGFFKWDPKIQAHDKLPAGNYMGVINLAGASIADTRWNQEGQTLIKDSRLQSTLFLKKVIDDLPNEPKHIISASAIGYYGFNNQVLKTEDDLPTNDFAATVCKEWERAAQSLKTSHNQLSILRIGIVLAKEGGFYKKIKTLAKWKIAAPIGTGLQPVPWIHVDDLVNIFISILEDKLPSGVYNAVTNNESNKDITKLIASKNKQPFLWPNIPTLLLKLIFSNKADILSKASPISNEKLRQHGFTFTFENLREAINNLEKQQND